MKKLIVPFLIFVILVGCTEFPAEPIEEPIQPMGYEYAYVDMDTMIALTLVVIDTLPDSLYALSCNFQSTYPIDISAISVILNYDTNVIFQDSATFSDKLHKTDLVNIDSLASTVFFNTGHSLGYSYISINEVLLQDEDIFTIVFTVTGVTKFQFSKLEGEVEFGDLYDNKYIVHVKNLKFKEKK